MRKSMTMYMLVALLVSKLTLPSFAEIFVDFDELRAGSQAGDVYASLGIRFSYGDIINTVAIGNQINFQTLKDGFEVVSGPFAVSGSNAASTFNNLDDNLLYFANPITHISLVSDVQAGETAADTVRLIALTPTLSPTIFQVVDYVESLDDGTSILTNTLTMTFANPVSFIAFQRTTEAESFDNLRFTAVPEPTSWLLCLSAMIGVSFRGLRRKRARNPILKGLAEE